MRRDQWISELCSCVGRQTLLPHLRQIYRPSRQGHLYAVLLQLAPALPSGHVSLSVPMLEQIVLGGWQSSRLLLRWAMNGL